MKQFGSVRFQTSALSFSRMSFRLSRRIYRTFALSLPLVSTQSFLVSSSGVKRTSCLGDSSGVKT